MSLQTFWKVQMVLPIKLSGYRSTFKRWTQQASSQHILGFVRCTQAENLPYSTGQTERQSKHQVAKVITVPCDSPAMFKIASKLS